MHYKPPPRRSAGRQVPVLADLEPKDAADFGRPPILKRKRGSSIEPVTLKPEYMTIDEAADFWRCSRRKVERKLRAKEIPKFKDGHRTLLRISDVRDHARKMRQK
jgi:excisionase family DNA binding protein